jgi:REP element-mobilizing transposase RayT
MGKKTEDLLQKGTSPTRQHRGTLTPDPVTTPVLARRACLENAQPYKPDAPAPGLCSPEYSLMSEALAYFLTWTAYGTWLPGDERGWVKKGVAEIQEPATRLEKYAKRLLKSDPVFLTRELRDVVEATIREHCKIRGWELHALNARSNHVHVVVTADIHPRRVLDQFKAWCTRRLNESLGPKMPVPGRWWTEGGSKRWINDARHLQNAIQYVMKAQDLKAGEAR